MSDRFSFDDAFFPVPPAAVDADPSATIRNLLYRVSRLEQSLEEQRVQAIADLKELMLELVSLSDDITNMVERWGVTTNAREATMVRGIVALGKKLLELLKHHQVRPINTVGEPLDPETSDVVHTEVRDHLPPYTVLRELQIGYTWPHGLLRRAKVVVSIQPETSLKRDEKPSDASMDSLPVSKDADDLIDDESSPHAAEDTEGDVAEDTLSS